MWQAALSAPGAVSIHAPARGATDDLIDAADRLVFQSTHPRGVRQDNGQIQQGA